MEPTIAATPAGRPPELLEVLHGHRGRLGVGLEARREELDELVDVLTRCRHDRGPVNGAAVAFASRPSGVISALGPSSSPLNVGTTATPTTASSRSSPSARRAVTVSPTSDVEVTARPGARARSRPASVATGRPGCRCRASPRRSSTACPSTSSPRSSSGALAGDGHLADERAVEDLALEVLDRHVGDADVVGDGGPGGGVDQAIEAGDEHQAGDDAGDPDHRRR